MKNVQPYELVAEQLHSTKRVGSINVRAEYCRGHHLHTSKSGHAGVLHGFEWCACHQNKVTAAKVRKHYRRQHNSESKNKMNADYLTRAMTLGVVLITGASL